MDEVVLIRIPHYLLKDIDQTVDKHTDLYLNRSNFIRSSIIREIRRVKGEIK